MYINGSILTVASFKIAGYRITLDRQQSPSCIIDEVQMKEATPPGASLTVSLTLVVIVRLLSSYLSSKQNGILYCPVSPDRNFVIELNVVIHTVVTVILRLLSLKKDGPDNSPSYRRKEHQ